jgi:glycosyltransferase involved in cell wall biosynthesis
MTRPLLTIAIPTYNRDVWLDTSLGIIGEEIKELDIEIVVSNNASIDYTESVIQKHKTLFPFVYNCNSENIGAVRNIYKCISLASGKFVWVLGDDDFLIPGFLKKILNLIKDNQEIPFFFVDMKVWYPKKDYRFGDIINFDDFIDNHYLNIKELKYFKHNELKKIATIERGYFNAISNFILLKEDYSKAFIIGVDAGEEFTSIESTFPHSYYIAKFLMNEPCIEVVNPGLICSHAISWRKYYEITWMKWFPELVILMVKYGADKKNALNGRRSIIKSKSEIILPKLFNGKVSNHEYFSWFKFLKDNFYIREFWIIILLIFFPNIKGLVKKFKDK